MFSICSHSWAACLFYYSASWNNFGPNTWVYRANLVPDKSKPFQFGQNVAAYTNSLYWAVVTMVSNTGPIKI